MATKAQMNANRNNAKKSTGPRTNEGKQRSGQNALKHGLLARDAVLPGEDPADFDRQLCDLEDTIEPKNALEFKLVRQIADAEWRLRRLTRLETGYLAAARDKTQTSGLVENRGFSLPSPGRRTTGNGRHLDLTQALDACIPALPPLPAV